MDLEIRCYEERGLVVWLAHATENMLKNAEVDVNKTVLPWRGIGGKDTNKKDYE